MASDKKTRSCADRINGEWAGRLREFRALLDAGDGGHPDYGILEEAYYGWYTVGAKESPRSVAYMQLVLSGGGPAEQLRFYDDGIVEYVFLDWGDGASIDVTKEPIVWELYDRLGGLR